MVLVLHTDQLDAERSKRDTDLYKEWVGSEEFQHDHCQAQDIAVRLMKFLHSAGQDIKAQLKKAEAFLEEMVKVCTREVERTRKSPRKTKPFCTHILSDLI